MELISTGVLRAYNEKEFTIGSFFCFDATGIYMHIDGTANWCH